MSEYTTRGTAAGTRTTDPAINPATRDDPDAIRRDIEATQAELSSDVDALADKVTPSKVVHRKVDSAKDRVVDVRDRVMGKADETTARVSDTAHGMTGSVSDAGHRAGDLASSAKEQTRSKARGNPLAAGLIAFGAGWLVGSLLPATEKEKETAAQAKDRLQEKAQPVMEQAKESAREVGENLKQPAQEAAQSVKDRATDATETVKGEARSGAQGVADDASGAAKHVKDQARS